ncbi:MAG: hypothetical protein WBB27_04070 [Maribacter sp.]
MALFENSKEQRYKIAAVKHLQNTLKHWKLYGETLSQQYHKMKISIHGKFDWDTLTEEVKKDIKMARNSK